MMVWVDGVLREATSEEMAQHEPTPTPRRLIPKSVIHERVNDIGKLDAALSALQSQAILYARWFAPDWPNVYADDPEMLTLLSAIGCTEAEITEITAPV